MNPAEFLRLVTEVCALALPPGITPDRLLDYAQVESGLNPQAISPPNRNGTRDYGLFQINQMHFARFGVTAETVREPCTNLRLGVTLLAEADRAAACLYNTGRALCRNGYPEKIAVAATRRPPVPSAPALTPAQADEPWDVWTEPSPAPAGAPEAAPVEVIPLRLAESPE